MVNAQLLDRKITDSGLKQSYIISKIGISRQAYYKKRSGKSKFRVAEMYVLSDLLNLSDSEKEEIFYAKEVN